MKKLILLVPAFLCGLIFAADLPDGNSLLPANPYQNLSFGGAQYGNKSMTPSGNLKFKDAVRVSTDSIPKESYQIQLVFPVTGPIAQDDVILATFYLRSPESRDETGEARTEMLLEGTAEPRNGYSGGMIDVGHEWKEFNIPVVAKVGFKTGNAHLTFRMGFKKQVIELGGLQLVNYGKKVSVRDLPTTSSTYQGREPNAAWRKPAQERIAQIRQADLNIEIVNRNGKPVVGAAVDVQMKRHAFGFGTAVNADFISGKLVQSEDGRIYRENLKKLFNLTVDEGELKWPQWEGPKKQEGIDMVEWLRANGLTVRGHNLIWERWDRLPSDLADLKNNPDALRKRVNDHLRDEVSFFKGKFVDWDVENEPIPNHSIRDITGATDIAEWYRLVRKIDPAAKLYVNDYQIEGTNPSKLGEFCAFMDFMASHGAPIDGIGSQCHIGGSAPAIDDVLKSFDRLGKYASEIKITEYDMDVYDEKLQADFTRDILTAAFSHPKMSGFVIWGFWDGRHWKKNSPVYRKDWSLKPAGQVWLDLIYKEWWTHASGKSGAKGSYFTRGFLGDYDVTVTVNSKKTIVPVKLEKGGTKVKVVVE